MQRLRRGDQRLIAEATGLSIETVKKVVRGERKNDLVSKTIGRLLSNREAFIEETQKA